MQSLLRELKAIVQFEQELFGSFVPLSNPDIDVPAPGDLHDRPEKAAIRRSSPQEESMPDSQRHTKQIDSGRGAGLTPYDRIHALIPESSPLRGLTTLEEVEQYVRETVLIPLDRTRKNPVFGVGNPNADIMVIGEAPGADEDAQGEPFVGRAGQLLTKILEAIQFPRSDVYIANILKSRPPNNRDPLPAEVEAHVPILYKQIALIRPKLILSVGKTSGNTLLKQQSTLGALRQKFHDFHGLPLLITYHPAALLRNPQWKRPTWEDVQLLRKQYDHLLSEEA